MPRRHPRAFTRRTRTGGRRCTRLRSAASATCSTRLVKAGGKIDEADHDGDTPVHYAAVQGELDRVLLLAAAGAKLEVKDNDGETP